MKRTKLATGAIVLSVAVMGAGWAIAGVEGSKHDFSNQAWSKGDRCGVCHTPHRDKPPPTAPLWDRTADLSRRFGLPRYEGSGPSRGTRLCLSCHDGTVAADKIPLEMTRTYTNKQHPGVFQAGHGTTDHPVGVGYPQFNKGFRPMATVLGQGTVALPDGKVECISCHDPHDTRGVDKMLVTSNTRSALCLTCHKK